MSVQKGEITCPVCGAKLKYYDHVTRLVRGEFGKKDRIKIRRLKCTGCGKLHRELPSLIPHVQFRADIVNGIVEGSISYYDLEYEDYPCEMTMDRWRRRFGKNKPKAD